MKHWWKIVDRENRITRTEAYPADTLATEYNKWTGQDLNRVSAVRDRLAVQEIHVNQIWVIYTLHHE